MTRVYFCTGTALSALPAGVLYAQTGPQPSPVARFSLVTQPIHYQTAALNAAVKTSSGEQSAEQTTAENQQTQQQPQGDGNGEIPTVQNITFAAGNAFPPGSYAGVIPTAQAYGNAYMDQQPVVAGKN